MRIMRLCLRTIKILHRDLLLAQHILMLWNQMVQDYGASCGMGVKASGVKEKGFYFQRAL